MSKFMFVTLFLFSVVSCQSRSMNAAETEAASESFRYLQLPQAFSDALQKIDKGSYKEGREESSDNGALATNMSGEALAAMSILDLDNSAFDKDRTVGRIDCNVNGVAKRAAFQVNGNKRSAFIHLRNGSVNSFLSTNETFVEATYKFSILSLVQTGSLTAAQSVLQVRYLKTLPNKLEVPGLMRSLGFDGNANNARKMVHRVELVLN